jgi:hypothetical protein
MVFFLFSRLDNDASERIVLFRILNKTHRRPLSGWNWISEWEEEKPTIFSYHCIYDEKRRYAQPELLRIYKSGKLMVSVFQFRLSSLLVRRHSFSLQLQLRRI